MVLRWVRCLVLTAQAAAIGVSFYQTAVTLLGGSPRPAGDARRPRPERPRFGLLVCARNEERVVGGILSDLLDQSYDAELVDVVLVAHNCSDGTPEAGRRLGVTVVELQTALEGKTAAMRAGIRHLLACDMVGVFDADSRAPHDMLAQVAAAAVESACVQVETVPRRSDDWLSTGYGLGRLARNLFWWRPREVLGLGTTFSGSGYFIRPQLLHDLLEEVHTLTEDLELTALLYARGERVRFLSSTHVVVEEPRIFAASLRQRLRWVRGHFAVIRHYALPLAREAARGNPCALDMTLYLLAPSRVLTRSAITFAFVLTCIQWRVTLPRRLLGAALICEWLVPAWIAVRARLVPLSLGGLEAAARHGLLNLLWFPIGVWALLTPGNRAWDSIPRAAREEDCDAATID